MSITTDSWTVQIDKMPGNTRLVVRGKVTMPHAGYESQLVRDDDNTDQAVVKLSLNLAINSGPAAQVVTTKDVVFECPGDFSDLTEVQIQAGANHIVIKEFEITH
ncbi:TPA: hypothetical protein ACKP22_005134 [Pseudomonas putida]